MAGIPDKTIIFRKFDLWWPLLTSIFTWAKKWPKWLRTGSLRAVDRRIARPSSFPSFRVRGGVILAPPTMAKVAETATRARVNTRTGGGGGSKKCPPLRFFADSGKTTARSDAIFSVPAQNWDTLCKNFNPRSPKVRSPGQVKVKNGFLTLRLRSGHTRYPIGFKPSVFHKMIDSYNLYISDFWYLWPEVRSISWPHHYKSMGKNSNRSYWMIMRQNHLNPS